MDLFTKREWIKGETELTLPPWRETFARDLGVSLTLGLALAVMGPYGTFGAMSFPARAAYWVGLMVLGAILYGATTRFAFYLLKSRKFIWPAPVAFSALAASIPMTIVVLLVTPGFGGSTSWQTVYLYVAAIGLGANFLFGFLNLRRHAQAAPGGAAQGGAGGRLPAFLARIPNHLGDEIYCVGSEDHYIRVQTSKGDALILMRFKDALTELSELPGIQVHRSWWVMETAIVKTVRKERRVLVQLKNGVEAPVSKRFLPKLRAARFL